MIVASISAGDSSAFAMLVVRIRSICVPLCGSHARNREDAEEAMQAPSYAPSDRWRRAEDPASLARGSSAFWRIVVGRRVRGGVEGTDVRARRYRADGRLGGARGAGGVARRDRACN